MPLSKPSARTHIHTRDIDCRGYERSDGLWDIEARLVDTKSYSFDNHDRGGINAGEAIHDMSIRLTLNDEMTVVAAEAVIDASPFKICPQITSGFKQLEGETIGPGWRKIVIGLFGKTRGCTHLTGLLTGQVAQTAHQTVHQARQRRHGQETGKTGDDPAKDMARKPAMLDTCHALKSDGPVVAHHWPDFYIEKKQD